MISLLGAVLVYWGVQLLGTDDWLIVGVLLIVGGIYIFGYSLSIPLDTGRAFG